MIKNKTFINFIMVTLMVSFLTIYVGKVTPIYALAVGPLADPVYDTEIIAFKDYVEQNLSAPQLDIMFFLVGGLAVAQMGAQDAMLITPYPNEENVKEWIINCGIQLYNAVIGLVPEGDYYMGIPSIGSAGTKGVPRQVIKALVAQMMGDAVVAINYPDLDTFLEENPDRLLLPFNKDLQLGVNAIFGLGNGLFDWQVSVKPFKSSQSYKTAAMTATQQANYASYSLTYNTPLVRVNVDGDYYNYRLENSNNFFSTYTNMFVDTLNNVVTLRDDNGNTPSYNNFRKVYTNSGGSVSSGTDYNILPQRTFNPALFSTFVDLVNDVYNNSNVYMISRSYMMFFEDFIKHVYVGTTWAEKVELFNSSNLNISDTYNQYYQQVTNDYLFDLRGLMGDLVNYVYLNPIWDNIYDLFGNLVLPDRVNVSVDLTPITDLLAPPVPVNMNDIAELTENTYLERVKEHARNAGDIFANYVAFWHNCDSDLVYTMFGAVILVLVGAFVGKWGHS